jgi:hypothetical protein
MKTNTVVSDRYLIPLAEFISGRIDSDALQEFVSKRLFELLRSSKPSQERSVLYTIDLYIHEINEGFRDKADLYSFIQSAL